MMPITVITVEEKLISDEYLKPFVFKKPCGMYALLPYILIFKKNRL